MNNDRKTEIRVGLTVILGIILFIFIYGWAKNYSLDSDEISLKIEFPTAAGLEIGDMVSLNGVRRGLVNSIENTNNIALVEVVFNEAVDIKEDATFSIMMLDLMGGKKIEITAGNSLEEIDYSKVQKGIFAGDISTAMATLSSVESDLLEVVTELKLSLQNVNSLFKDDDFSQNLRKSIANTEELTRNINKLITKNNEAITATLNNTKEITDKTISFIDDNESNLKSSISNLNVVLENSNEVVQKLSKILSEVDNSENNLGKLLNDESLINDFKTTLKQVKELTDLINNQLKSEGLKVDADVDLF